MIKIKKMDNQLKEKTAIVEDVSAEDILILKDLKKDFTGFKNVMDSLSIMTNKRERKNLAVNMDKPNFQPKLDKFIQQAKMMKAILSSAKNAEEAKDLASQSYENVAATKKQNLENILKTIRPTEQVLRAAQSFFDNASTTGEVENVKFVMVEANKFAGGTNSSDFDEYCKILRRYAVAHGLKDSPHYTAYIGDIDDKGGELAAIAQDTLALAVADIEKLDSPSEIKEVLDQRGIGGSQAKWGHLVVIGNWITARKVYEGLNEELLEIPSAAAVIGKFLATALGYSGAGYEEGTTTVKGVEMYTDTEDDAKAVNRGYIHIAMEDGIARIYGNVTAAYASANEDLTKIIKVRVSNAILKDLVDFCNKKAFGTWNHQTKKNFKEQIQLYLNDCVRHQIIQGYEEPSIISTDSQSVDIDVEILFSDSKSVFNIQLSGVKGAIQMK